tara:strand:- start:551 stop:1672 length:1122 start_codon:yes stop_codon:yes gene_type:complete
MLCFLLLFIGIYPWFFYPIILLCFPTDKNKTNKISFLNSILPSISVVISVYNEEKTIGNKILDVYNTNYPSDKLNVMVLSDGSVDNTVLAARRYLESFSSLSVIELPRCGRAICHNHAASISNSDILIFTDSDTQFSSDFLLNIVKPFENPQVAISVGKLIFRDASRSTTAASFQLFWRFELFLRHLEDRLGLLIFGTGACMAVRKANYTTVPKNCDIDFFLSLHIAKSNLKSSYQRDALAYDYVYPSSKAEYKARVRQVSRNFRGYLDFWKFKDYLNHPIYSFVLLSHKYLRWLSPLFLCLSLFSSFFIFSNYSFVIFVMILLLLALNIFPDKFNYLLGPLLPLYNLCLISKAFIHGSYLAFTSQSSATYES